MTMRSFEEIIEDLLDIDQRINRLGFIYFGKGGFNPNQPRVPAGNPHGGQWTGGGGVSPRGSRADLYRPTDNNQGTRTVEERVNSSGITEEEDRLGLVEESYLFDFVLGVAGLVRGLASWTAQTVSRSTAEAALVYSGSRAANLASRDAQRIMQTMEKYLGGKPRVIINKNGDIVMMRGNKKIRFDINHPHGHDPHFQIEMYVNGKWVSIGNHHYYFRK